MSVINVPEAARRLGISKPLAYQLVRREDFPAFQIGGRWVIHEESFEAWIKEQANKKTEVKI